MQPAKNQLRNGRIVALLRLFPHAAIDQEVDRKFFEGEAILTIVMPKWKPAWVIRQLENEK